MNAKEYIINRLKEFTEEFKNARVRYEHDAYSQTHTIEVMPQGVFDSQDFLDWECGLFDQFSIEYPGDVLGFISEDALVGIEKVDFECEGIHYNPFTVNTAFVFITPVANINVSTTKTHGVNISFSDSQTKDNFEKTVLQDSDFLNNYKLAA